MKIINGEVIKNFIYLPQFKDFKVFVFKRWELK